MDSGGAFCQLQLQATLNFGPVNTVARNCWEFCFRNVRQVVICWNRKRLPSSTGEFYSPLFFFLNLALAWKCITLSISFTSNLSCIFKLQKAYWFQSQNCSCQQCRLMWSVKHIPQRWFASSVPISCGKGSSHRLSLTILWKASLWWSMAARPRACLTVKHRASWCWTSSATAWISLWQGQQAQGLLGHQSSREPELDLSRITKASVVVAELFLSACCCYLGKLQQQQGLWAHSH